MNKKTATVTSDSKINKGKKEVKSTRKKTNASTREGGRQRSGNNDPQKGSH